MHRDIKPENILLVDETAVRIKLADFGLSKYFEGGLLHSSSANSAKVTCGTLCGTPSCKRILSPYFVANLWKISFTSYGYGSDTC